MTDRRPNILLIVSDDHGYGDRSAISDDPLIKTPVLDRLAADGVTCPEAYVTAPICSPSRAAIMTGCHQRRWDGVWFDSATLPPAVPTLAERLSAAGYRTGYFGKVHYGSEQPGEHGCPPHHGFEQSYYGLAGRQMGRLHYQRHSRAAVQDYGAEASWRMAVQPMLDGDDEVDLEGFLTDEITDRSLRFIDADDQRPYFCFAAFNAVHNFCWQLPRAELARRGLPEFADWEGDDGADYDGWYDGAISPNLPHGREYYAAQLELLDAAIGRLLDRVGDDAIVVYLTDNGGSTCNYGDNRPLAGGKYTLWEGGVRVPFIVRWPQRGWAGGGQRSGLVSSMDLLPTLLAAAGAGPGTALDPANGTDRAGRNRSAPAPVDGIDLGPLLDGDPSAGHDALFWDCDFQWAVRDGRWKLRWADGDDPRVQHLVDYEHAHPGAGLGLFDLVADPGETVNLVDREPAVAARLRAEFERWRAATAGTVSRSV